MKYSLISIRSNTFVTGVTVHISKRKLCDIPQKKVIVIKVISSYYEINIRVNHVADPAKRL